MQTAKYKICVLSELGEQWNDVLQAFYPFLLLTITSPRQDLFPEHSSHVSGAHTE